MNETGIVKQYKEARESAQKALNKIVDDFKKREVIKELKKLGFLISESSDGVFKILPMSFYDLPEVKKHRENGVQKGSDPETPSHIKKMINGAIIITNSLK